MTTKVEYLEKLPTKNQFSSETVLFYDSILIKQKSFKKWTSQFKYKIALKSGENLKTVDKFTEVLTKITKLNVPQTTNLTFVAVGGGSVGDFVGFVASVFLRGRKLILIPSTWLSAVDSAHGGKTGLNFLKTKNQIGSFYPAEKTIICKELLSTQPAERLTEAMGEIIKIALLQDKKLFSDIEKLLFSNNAMTVNDIYKKLPKIINLKYQVVKQDPFEIKGQRRILNLGHTLGHVFESTYQWPHGICVLLGMQFSLQWSFQQKRINEAEYIRIAELLSSLNFNNKNQNLLWALENLNKKKTLSLLLKDKKLVSTAKLDFIFIEKIGRCQRESVLATDILQEMQRQIQEY